MPEISAGPEQPRVDMEKAKTHALADLRQSVWEAAQFLSLSDIEAYVMRVCDEIKSDEM